MNKLNTKAEIRFNVPSADWLSADIRERLQLYYPNKITKDGDLVVTSQEHRLLILWFILKGSHNSPPIFYCFSAQNSSTQQRRLFSKAS